MWQEKKSPEEESDQWNGQMADVKSEKFPNCLARFTKRDLVFSVSC